MVSNLKMTLGVAISAAVVIIGTVWQLRGALVTQVELASAMLQLDAKLTPLLTAVEKVGSRIEDVDRRLSRLEGRMDSARSP